MVQPPDPGEAAITGKLENLERELASVLADLHQEIDVEAIMGESFSIGKYRLAELLGRGGQAYVFRGVDTELRRDVVIKLYPKKTSESDKAKVLHEGQVMSGIDNPNVVRCYTSDQLNGIPFLVMEFVCGETLPAYANRVKPSPTRCVEMVSQIARGLEAVHEEGFLHLDLKPGNIMVNEQGVAKLIDFGLAEPVSGELVHVTSGTPGFLAPERANGQDDLVGVATDVFGLGGILYYLLTGQAPFDGQRKDEVYQQAKRGSVRPARDLNARVPAEISHFCDKSLERDPARRHPDVRRWIRAAAKITGSRSQLSRQKKTIILLLIFFLAAAGIPGYYYLTDAAKRNENLVLLASINRRTRELLRNIERIESAVLANRFPIEAVLHDEGGNPLERNREGTYLIPANTVFSIHITTPESCYIGIVSFNAPEAGRGEITECVPIFPANETELATAKFAAGESRRLLPLLVSSESSPGVVEYIYVAACDFPWKPVGFQIDSNTSSGQIRGIQRHDERQPLSELLVPILVTRPAPHEETDDATRE